jgi:hypothetical protein
MQLISGSAAAFARPVNPENANISSALAATLRDFS